MDFEMESPPELVEDAASISSGTTRLASDSVAAQMSDLSLSKVPLTIITGYLGSGKTTLVNHILQAEHGKKIAVILNEFGDTTTIERRAINVKNPSSTSTDQPLAIDFLELGNGCICCSVKDTGVAAIEALLAKHSSTPGEKPFDYIVLETSGLADPGGIIPLFWLDDALGSSLYLDGVICVVDAGNLSRNLDQPNPDHLATAQRPTSSDNPKDSEKDDAKHETVAHLQLSTADAILLNKIDTLSSPSVDIEAIESRIRSINALAPLTHTTFSVPPNLEGALLNLHAYDKISSLPTNPAAGKHAHLDPTISTITLPLPVLSKTGIERLEDWLRCILWANVLPPPFATDEDEDGEPVKGDFEVHRTKGLAGLKAGGEVMIQGVREVFEIVILERDASKDGEGKIVFIGRGLKLEEWRLSVNYALGV
ncbi:uncharacterized protein KY384_003386 [Bacidia gigantensis]|uniref:uncharacterized protein n=1 Tax=Bacidia gigantensis TaxID=2732470 RepID=UPI001D036FEA|nr:uncharacterized protein KY384_003386 [Bacidia gigantensis]KAG8531754.1 hypothetical protein KY384_003386 [Bacidia gigantensis]